jgi:hypothetical protein
MAPLSVPVALTVWRMIRSSGPGWRRRRCQGRRGPRLPVPTIGMTVEQLAAAPRRALAALTLGGAVIVLDDGGVLGVLTRDRRVRRGVRLALALQPALALADPAGAGERG